MISHRMKAWVLSVTLAGLALMDGMAVQGAEEVQKPDAKPPAGTSRLTVGGGCFWCVEAVFERVPGVLDVVSGYAGGHLPNPTYQDVLRKTTGHAEVVQITFDTRLVTLDTLLEVFWASHDPTTPNRQGADVGPQYRSIILYADEEQRVAAEKSKARANAADFGGRIVTQIVPLTRFYEAEAYHQDYFQKNPNQPYCQAVIRPKLRKLMEKKIVP